MLHGVGPWEHKILQECDNIVEALKAEQRWIAELNTLVPNGYNGTPGGELPSGMRIDDIQKCIKEYDVKKQPVIKDEIVKIEAFDHLNKIEPDEINTLKRMDRPGAKSKLLCLRCGEVFKNEKRKWCNVCNRKELIEI